MFFRSLGDHLVGACRTQRPAQLGDLNACEKTEPSLLLVTLPHFCLRGRSSFLSIGAIPTEQGHLSLAFVCPDSNNTEAPWVIFSVLVEPIVVS